MIDDSLPRFLRTRDAVLAGTDRTLRVRFERGELTRIRSGIYIPTSDWNTMDADHRYRTRVAAAGEVTQLGTQFSHDSAAALWRLPSLGRWSPHVHVLGRYSSGARASTDLRRHTLALDTDPTAINGLAITSLARTAIDISCTSTFTRAVGMVDDAMRVAESDDFRGIHSVNAVSRKELLHALDALMPYYGSVRVRRVLEFATSKSGSLGESISRVQMHALGLAAPELQVPFFDSDGFIGFVDFYWPELDLIGEFDGLVKYRDQKYLRGRLPMEAVIDEKVREDRLRQAASAFTRWGWATAIDRARLERHLAQSGLLRTR